MKITFSNLGAIKKTTLDLRPLTVIIGPNNSNKTYIAYSIYGLLKELTQKTTSHLLSSLGYNYDNPSFLVIEPDKLYKIDSNGNYSYKINKSFFLAYQKDCQKLAESFEEKLNVFFQDTSGNLFDYTEYEFTFTKNELIKALKKIVNRNINPILRAYEYTLERNVFYARYIDNAFLKKDEANNYVASDLGFDLRLLLYPKPILLPAERNALITTYKILENRRYDLLKEANRKLVQPFLVDRETKQNNIRYPEPIEDFLKFLTNLEIEVGAGNENRFSEIAIEIEEHIQQKNKTSYVQTEVGGNEIKINVKKGLDIDLYNASSSIKQLTPLLLYLRYRAQENDLLIIDEPEMNLHPESQAKLLEVLGMLVNAGVNVLLTTHSPYFMSHLNNLISGDMTNDETREKQAKSLYLEDDRAFLKPEDVSAYEMRQNKAGNQTLHDLKDKDYGIRWDTLSDVSGVIQQKYFEIYEKGKQSSNGEES